MSGRSKRFLLFLLSLYFVFVLCVSSSSAQAAYTVALSVPDISKFPHISAYLDVHGPDGAFVHGLTAPDVTIQENETQLAISKLEELKPGVQFVIAISSGESFRIRDGQGISRYEYLLQGLLGGTWISQPAGMDDFSLLTVGGPQLTHVTDPDSLLGSLESYQPDDSSTTPNLEVLAAALQVASDPTVRPGMERAILLITPPIETDVSLGLQSIIASANQQSICINVWLVAAPDIIELPKNNQLRYLAAQTGGAFFAFSHDELIPDLETLLEPLRYVYQLGYTSQITAEGPQQVVAQVGIGTDLIISPPQSFEIDLQPPMPVIVNPPAQIMRSYAIQPTPGKTAVSDDLLPVEQSLALQVTFPDGYDRSIVKTSLYIDGAIASENTSPPFDQLTWDLRPYIEDGEHILSVEVTDSLGLVGKTADTSVKIIVPSTTQGLIAAVSQKRTWIIGSVVLVSASLLILVLILGGRIHPKPHPSQVIPPAGSGIRKDLAGYRERKRLRKDPLTQPVTIATSSPTSIKSPRKRWKVNLLWLRRKEKPVQVMAYLVPLVGSSEATLPIPLKITEENVTLGSDSHQSDLVITNSSIDGQHACIRHTDKTFLITDMGSVAGTWVNYEPVPSEGTHLEHLDIIYFGKIGCRFKLAEPGRLPKVIVTPLESDQ